MKIIVDANRVIAALVKSSTTRSILFAEDFKFLSPDHILAEIDKHREELQRKTKLAPEEFDLLINILFERITILPKVEYLHFIKICEEDMCDKDDIPYLAACLASKAEGIWSHDPHFSKQSRIKVFTNIDLLDYSRSAKSD